MKHRTSLQTLIFINITLIIRQLLAAMFFLRPNFWLVIYFKPCSQKLIHALYDILGWYITYTVNNIVPLIIHGNVIQTWNKKFTSLVSLVDVIALTMDTYNWIRIDDTRLINDLSDTVSWYLFIYTFVLAALKLSKRASYIQANETAASLSWRFTIL